MAEDYGLRTRRLAWNSNLDRSRCAFFILRRQVLAPIQDNRNCSERRPLKSQGERNIDQDCRVSGSVPAPSGSYTRRS